MAAESGRRRRNQFGHRGLGGRVAADHRAQPFDVVLDYLWGTTAEQVLAALGNVPFHVTRFVQIGDMAGPKVSLPAGTFRSAGIELVGMGFAVCRPRP